MKAFLSHSSRDKSLVEKVASRLGADQIELDSSTFDSGLLNVEAIQTALTRSSIFVLFLTLDALNSSYVRFEVLQASELLAKRLLDKFLVICLDERAFLKAEEQWKIYNFVRHLISPQSIARLIQNHLIMDRAKTASSHQPYVGRNKESDDLKEQLLQPGKPPAIGIYVSGNAGIGRRTFTRHFYRDRYPSVNAVFPEIQIDSLDGYDEIFKKLSNELLPTLPLTNFRTRIVGFSIADDNGKAIQIASLFDQLIESREAIFLRDGGGLLDHEGALQSPLKQIFSKIKEYPRPTIVFIAERMIPRLQRGNLNIAYCALPSMTNAQIRQLAGSLLSDAKITYTNDDLEQIISLSDGHPLNVKFFTEQAKEYTLPVALADTGELTQWKKNRGSEFLRKINFTDEEKTILGALRDLNTLDFPTIQRIVAGEIAVSGKALARLMDFHVVEGAGDTYQVSPPLRIAVGRDNRFALDANRRQTVLNIVSNLLTTERSEDEFQVSMIDAGILATLQAGKEIPEMFSSFLLPSHQIWLARRHYDDKRWPECARLALIALDSVQQLSPAGKVEACRLLCLSSARMDRQDDFKQGIAMLRRWADDSWAQSNVHFLLGFNARLDGNLPLAEQQFRDAYGKSQGNFSAIRELAAICKIRNDLDQAEFFARKAFERAPDNGYILDILLSVLIACDRNKLREREPEIEFVFQRLKSIGEESGRSFYTTRRAEYELKQGNIPEASRMIDAAAEQTPGIFDVHALRARIYLERGIKSIAMEEIEKMRRVVYRESAGERRTNLRPLREIESSYFASTGDFQAAKKIYDDRNVFTEKEAQDAVRAIDYEQAIRQR